MKIRCILGTFALYAQISLGEIHEISIDRGSRAFPSKSAEQAFKPYLGERRAGLIRNNSTLSFPEKFNDPDRFFDSVDSRSPQFVNREHHCRFAKKLASTLIYPEEISTLKRITSDGKICVAGDLPQHQQAEWSLKMHRFVWTSHWLLYNGTLLDAHAYIASILKRSDLPQVEIRSWVTANYDATYASLSSQDQQFVNSHNSLRNLVDGLKSFDIDDPKSIPDGPMRRYAERSGVYVADVFFGRPAIWISPSSGPADAVDTLFHEYGHIVFDLQRSNFTLAGNNIRYFKEQLQDEACAETFSWLLLRPFYEKFPELEFSHIFKLYGLSQLKKDDPHYTGSAMLFRLINNSKDPLQMFQKLILAHDFASFLVDENQEAVIQSGSPNIQRFQM